MITQILPVFLVIAFGWFLRAVRIADNQWITVLNKFGLYIGFPSLLFLSVLEADASELLERLPLMSLNVTMLILFMVGTYFVVRAMKLPQALAGSFVIGSINGNVGYLGFPLIVSVLPGSEAELGLLIALYPLTVFSIGVFLLESLTGEKKDVLGILRSIATNPFILAIFLGFVVVVGKITLPPFIMETLKMVKGSASPVVLISLGIFLYRKISIARIWKSLVSLTILKVLLFPAAFILAGAVLGWQEEIRIAVLEASMPAAIANFVISDRYHMDKELLASHIFVTTILSPVVFTLFLLIV